LKRLTQLDGIRGEAVLAVVLFHLELLFGSGAANSLYLNAEHDILFTGWLGVDVFFVLSGFLITRILLEGRSKPDYWSAFYSRRAFRILPPFIVVFVATLLGAHFIAPDHHISPGFVFAATFFMANWTAVSKNDMLSLTHLWTLAVEEQFYLLWPQVVRRLTTPTLFRLTLVLAAGSGILRLTLVVLHVDASIIYRITPTHIDGLAIGAALSAGMTLLPVRLFLTHWWKQTSLFTGAMLPLAFLMLRGNLSLWNGWSQVLAIPLVSILTAMLIYGVVESALPATLARFLGNPAMTYLGRRSYALYLIHMPVFVAAAKGRDHGILRLLPHGFGETAILGLLAVAASLILAELSWRTIEAPAQELRRRWMRPGKKPVRGIEPAASNEVWQLDTTASDARQFGASSKFEDYHRSAKSRKVRTGSN